jgi:two-component system sensor histidine kinase KdpD
LIDISPEELIKRLKDGKVYIPEQASQALHKFFRAGNINALRELSLRYTARRVDTALQDYMLENRIDGPWPAAGRVLVCVGDNPFSAQLIRAAHRLATGMQSELLALHVESSTCASHMTDATNEKTIKNLRLAEELGAKILSTIADDICAQIIEVSRNHNVSAIVIGRPRRSRLKSFFSRSIVDKLIQQCEGIHVHVVSSSTAPEFSPGPSRSTSPHPQYSSYGLSLLLVLGVTGFNWFFSDTFELVNMALLYQIPVTLSAFWWGRWPSYVTALVSVAFFDFLFIPPLLTFSVDDIRYLWSFITFLVVAFVIGGRTDSLRTEAAIAHQREKSTLALYEFSREIAAVIDFKLIAQRLATQASDTIGRPIAVLLPGANGALSIEAQSGNNELLIDRAEMAVAEWAFAHAEIAGRFTETLPGAGCMHVPLKSKDSVVGILSIQLLDGRVTLEKRRLIDAWAGLAAVAFERARLAEKARESALLAESDRLRTALFNSISHELRTPLSSIMGSASSLMDTSSIYSAAGRQELIENIHLGASRMEKIVTNLLDTARLESGGMKLKLDWCDIEDLIGSALRRLRGVLGHYHLETDIPPNLPLLRADGVLIEQVLINLLDNAMKYSGNNNRLKITAAQDQEVVTVAVLDRGMGIAPEELEKIFDKFFRSAATTGISGTGLGLSICKAIIEAHGGRIWPEIRPDGGTAMKFTLPTTDEPLTIPREVE